MEVNTTYSEINKELHTLRLEIDSLEDFYLVEEVMYALDGNLEDKEIEEIISFHMLRQDLPLSKTNRKKLEACYLLAHTQFEWEE